ncbi:hypothetical protein F2P81_021703 [Scophthalmus maximus]|uniref:Nucleoporin NUP35 n=1 Tax=Scophthalmus maximus TaxID=52904 RepID=A0A6A4RW26_SCOMX|nr:hypothetical protein F2P81_021703 [Scophthalmus maximus]
MELQGVQQQQQVCLSPAQVDPFYSQGETLSSDDQLDQTWITVFGFPPASASYILLQFAQYGNILKHTRFLLRSLYTMFTPGRATGFYRFLRVLNGCGSIDGSSVFSIVDRMCWLWMNNGTGSACSTLLKILH